VREWAPPYNLDGPEAPDENEKTRTIKAKRQLVREQFRSVSGHQDMLVHPVMSEEREGDLFGIDAFREQLFYAVPKVAKIKFARATKIAEKKSREVLEEIDRIADGAIAASAAAAAAAVLANPLPVSDWVVLVPLQTAMIVKIGAVYGKTLDGVKAKETALALGAGMAARTVFQGVISLFPGVKNFIGPPYAAAATYGMGVAAKTYFKTGDIPNKKQIEKLVEGELSRRGVK